MRPRIDLHLVRENLRQLDETTYFSEKLHTFTKKLIGAIDHVLAVPSRYSDDVVRVFADVARISQTYLAGSTTKEAPYEMEYCLRAAIPRWTGRETLITTALTSGQDFHLLPIDPWNFVATAVSGYQVGAYSPLLVLIGVPRIYRHKPIYCIPLYHELGHFIDETLGVIRYSLFVNPPPPGYDHEVVQSHRQEFFADLFAACYCGHASIRTLQTIAPHNPATPTHPATADRARVVEEFLGGIQNDIVDHFQSCLAALGAPNLMPLYSLPSIAQSYDDMRPFTLTSREHLHGIFESSWNYLSETLDGRPSSWAIPSLSDGDIERVVNDLTEKSIRNMSIKERWDSGITP